MSEATVDPADLRRTDGEESDGRDGDAPLRDDIRLLGRVLGEVNFEPNAPAELPQGFARAAIYVLKMPCCTCTQTIYKNSHGTVLALFEHTDQQRSWFGDRPTITAQCHGKATCLVQLQDELAACWKSGPRHLTLVGARDVEQVSDAVAHMWRSIARPDAPL